MPARKPTIDDLDDVDDEDGQLQQEAAAERDLKLKQQDADHVGLGGQPRDEEDEDTEER
jgi:hypothetical protein